MIYLAGSIVFTTFLAIALKICERLGISTFQAIIFNYLTCVITGMVMYGSLPSYEQVSEARWLPWAMVMGLFFITFFNLTALTVKQNGVAVTSVATKLSLVIPFIFSVFLYNEDAGIIKVIGVAAALIAVVLTCYRKRGLRDQDSFEWSRFLLPGIVFLGTGFLDTIIKYTEQQYVTDDSRDIFLTVCFAMAFITGSVIYIILLAKKEIQFQPRAIIAGVCIGIPNYLSIWCLIRALKQFGGDSSVIIPVNNMGIVLLSAVIAWLAFREKLSVINWIGITLAIFSILMISSDI